MIAKYSREIYLLRSPLSNIKGGNFIDSSIKSDETIIPKIRSQILRL